MKQLQAASMQSMRRWFWLLLLANILYIICTYILLHPLTLQEVVTFEIAKKVQDANNIIQDWELTGKYQKAILSIYLDFLFIGLYTALLAVSLAYFSRLTRHEILIKAGRIFTYLLFIAALCDTVENIAMLRSLKSTASYWSVTAAYDMAATKFSIIIVSLLFLFVCIFFWVLDAITGQHRKPTPLL